jgi:ubiquinol-cytochrome c reductase iron-sulfur subunit
MTDVSKDTTVPDEAQLAAMSNDELLALGGRIDGVETIFKEPRWPVEGTRAEKRAERNVAGWFLAAGGFGFALLLIFLFWPWEYAPLESPDGFAYSLATPLYGLTFGLSVLFIGIGAAMWIGARS